MNCYLKRKKSFRVVFWFPFYTINIYGKASQMNALLQSAQMEDVKKLARISTASSIRLTLFSTTGYFQQI